MSDELDLDALEAAAKATGDDDHLCIKTVRVLALIARIRRLEEQVDHPPFLLPLPGCIHCDPDVCQIDCPRNQLRIDPGLERHRREAADAILAKLRAEQ